MAMGTRKDRERQEDLWVAYTDMAVGPGHPFYVRLNEVLDGEGFDGFVEKLCARFYAEKLGRPGLTPGIYFRSLMIGYFEGIESERGIAWRLKDSLSLRHFVGIALDEDTPDHSTISRTRRLIDLETHKQVFSWVLGLLADRALLAGKRIGIDATTLEASAAMRSIVRRDTGESYEESVSYTHLPRLPIPHCDLDVPTQWPNLPPRCLSKKTSRAVPYRAERPLPCRDSREH